MRNNRRYPKVGEVWETKAGWQRSMVIDTGDRLRNQPARMVTLKPIDKSEPQREISVSSLLGGWVKVET